VLNAYAKHADAYTTVVHVDHVIRSQITELSPP
jgi:hypothetical protein